MEAQDRLELLIKKLDKNANSFANDIGVPGSYIYNIIRGAASNGGKKNKPSFDLLQKILKAYPQVNLVWLLTGEGEMFSESSILTTENTEVKKDDSFGAKVVDMLEAELNSYKEREKTLLETITNLSKH
jgi:hypothetical protein